MFNLNLLKSVTGCHPWTCIQKIMSQSSSVSKLSARCLSNNTALISKVHREKYLRAYPALVVQPDGSSYYIRYHEPRAIIKLPLDVSTLSAEALKLRLLKRQPRKKVVIAKEEKDTYQPSKYIKLAKKQKN